MANRYAVATGNWSATATWDGGTLPTSADDVYANGFTVTINQSATVLSVRTTSAAGIAAGGGFTVSASGFTLQADIYAGTTTCVTSTVTSGGTFTVATQTGVCLGGSTSSAYGVNNNSTGTVNITGNPTGGSGAAAHGALNNSTGTLNVTGNPTGGSNAATYGINTATTGTVNITGNPTGGSATNASGVNNNSTGTVNITGNSTGGSVANSQGVSNAAAGTVVITGSAIASSASVGAVNNSSGILRVTNAIGNGHGLGSVGVSSVAAVVSGTGNSQTYVQQLTFGSLGATPVSGPIILTDLTTNSVRFYREGGGTKTLVDQAATAGVLPAVGDVRTGTVYAAGNRTGTCAVPAAGSVALGVAVDNTSGTAVLTAANVQTALTSQGLTPTRAGYLDNISTAAPSAATIAAAVWASLTSGLSTVGSIGKLLVDNVNATISSAAADSSGVTTLLSRLTSGRAGNLDNLDATVSSRLASASYSAPPSAASIRAEIDSNSTKLDATVSSRLASASYQAPLDAAGTRSAVGLATGNLDTQLSGLSSGISGLPSASAIASAVWSAATRTLTTAIDNSSTIAAAVWNYATGRTITGGTVDTLVNSPSVPSAAAIASQVRTELSTELGRIDASVSSRLAPSGTLARVTLVDTTTTVANSSPVDAGEIAEAVRTELTPELARVANCATTQEVDDIIEGALQ